jgi:hypothetical protein
MNYHVTLCLMYINPSRIIFADDRKRMHLVLIDLHTELAPNVQQDDDTHKRQTCDQDSGRTNLKSRRIIGVKLQNVVSSS